MEVLSTERWLDQVYGVAEAMRCTLQVAWQQRVQDGSAAREGDTWSQCCLAACRQRYQL